MADLFHINSLNPCRRTKHFVLMEGRGKFYHKVVVVALTCQEQEALLSCGKREQRMSAQLLSFICLFRKSAPNSEKWCESSIHTPSEQSENSQERGWGDEDSSADLKATPKT